MGIRYGDEMIIVDAGMGFPEETPYGVDISIPNFDFLEEYRDDLTALILTHGHEDHIGALPYFLKKFNLPVYASRFTLRFGRTKDSKSIRMLDDVLLHRVEAERYCRNRQFQNRIYPRFAFAGRLFFAGDQNAARHDYSHRRLQNRRHAGYRQAL